MKILQLSEYKSLFQPREQIQPHIIDKIKQGYSNQIKVNLKYQQGKDYWEFIAPGWVGYIPVTPDFAIRISPKVPIKNLLGMLEYAYDLKSFQFLDGLTDCDDLEGFYNRLAQILSERLLSRFRQGLYQTYLPKREHLAYVRGRLEIKQIWKKPWDTKLTCHYNEQTKNIEDNQILLWTLYCISRNRICNPTVHSFVKKAYQTLRKSITLKAFTAEDCCGRKYNRLNQDYQQLHTLCKFFLANSMPSHQQGNYETIPFLVNMAQLYEKFVAEWLKINLPKHLGIKVQHSVKISPLRFDIDLIIYTKATGETNYILDTKYKNPDRPSNKDINQVVTYAISQGCSQAILIYPQDLAQPVNTDIGNIKVSTIPFCLQENITLAGNKFLQALPIIHSVDHKQF